MSTSLSKKFLSFAEDVADSLTGEVDEGDKSSRVSKSGVSPASILPGDVLFFSYTSKKFNDGNHLVMVIGNERGKYGVFTHMNKTGKDKGKAKRYLSAIKLNNVWSQTAGMIIQLYNKSMAERVEDAKYTKKQGDKAKKGLMSLVGRKNYRTYILNNMTNTFEVEKGEA